MDLFEILGYVSAFLVSIGGASVIFWKIADRFSTVIADRYIETIRKNHQIEIEKYKQTLEVNNQFLMRYSTQQFGLYNDLWRSLCKLKSSADDLWKEPNRQNLSLFSKLLDIAEKQVEQSALFIEDSHYTQFRECFCQLDKYKIGKWRIVELNFEKIDKDIFNEEIKYWVEKNYEIKLTFDNLIQEIKKDLRGQIKGTPIK